MAIDNHKGVALHHKGGLRNCYFTVENPARIYQEPTDCPVCLEHHVFKTYHFRLNKDGNVCVAPHVYLKLKEANMLKAFEALQDVTPLPTTIGLNDRRKPLYVVSQEYGKRRMEGKNVNADMSPRSLSQKILEGELSGQLSI